MGVDLATLPRQREHAHQAAAEGAGLSQSTVSRICAREREPLAETADRLVAWAERVAARRRIPVRRRLDRSKLRPTPERAA